MHIILRRFFDGYAHYTFKDAISKYIIKYAKASRDAINCIRHALDDDMCWQDTNLGYLAIKILETALYTESNPDVIRFLIEDVGIKFINVDQMLLFINSGSFLLKI